MGILRIIDILASDSRVIRAKFSKKLSANISKENISIIPVDKGVPAPLVTGVSVTDDILIVGTLPQTPLSKYKIYFKSTPGRKFSSFDSTDYLIEDGISNSIDFLGAENPYSPFRDNLVSYLQGTPYMADRGTVIRSYFNQIADGFSRASRDARQAKNDNYLSFFVRDERKKRSYGPYDQLNEEGAISVVRASRFKENYRIPGEQSFSSFPYGKISLQAIDVVSERILPGIGPGTFNNLKITLKNSPVIIIEDVYIHYQDGTSYKYDIGKYGYQIKDSSYDEEHAARFSLLKEDEVVLNNAIYDDGFVPPGGGDEIFVTYKYKDLGRIVDRDSISVFKEMSSVREPTPALTSDFSLAHFPILASDGTIAKSSGVIFTNPYSEAPFKTKHPAFLVEIPFTHTGMPRNPGEYSVDYERGRVFVYGADSNGGGTGAFPPAATYNYKYTFKDGLDYNYWGEEYELAASPLRYLSGETATISYKFDQVFVEGKDYKAGVHKEVLNERVGNRLLTSNSLKTLNGNITNVFKIVNETTSETYRLNRFVDNKVVFSANVPPAIKTSQSERVSFDRVSDEQIIPASDEIISGKRFFKVQLLHGSIVSESEDSIASSYNTSLSFSNVEIFANEIYYSRYTDLSNNIDRLVFIGDYCVDYLSGTVYVLVSNAQSLNIGSASYKRGVIRTEHNNITAVSDIFYSVKLSDGPGRKMGYLSFDEQFIYPKEIASSDERMVNDDTSMMYQVVDNKISVADDVKYVRGVYDYTDLMSNREPVDFSSSVSKIDGNVISISDIDIVIRGVLSSSLSIDTGIISDGITIQVSSIIRDNDGKQLVDGLETVLDGVITVSSSSGAQVGDSVELIIKVSLNNLSQPVVDYNRGEYYASYTYVADEILVSYEYGDNHLDFRESLALSPGDEYFVTYKVGALRDALLGNFGSMIDIPELNVFDVDLNRERYRDSLAGALQSFTRGPTISSIKDMVASVTKAKPEIIESVFKYWSLGITPLFLSEFGIFGNKDNLENGSLFSKGEFDLGFFPSKDGERVTFPVSSNLSLNEGTLQFTAIPQWDGLDNDAVLTFKNILINGEPISADNIFIGSSSYHPEKSEEFSISRFDTLNNSQDLIATGIPGEAFSNSSWGIFIYYDTDVKRWRLVSKAPLDGNTYQFSGEIFTSGDFYDVKPDDISELGDKIRSSEKRVLFSFSIDGDDELDPSGFFSNDGYVLGFSFDGLSLMSDSRHYFFDFAETESTNRFSLYKDGKGYLNFSVWDKGGGYGQDPGRRSVYTVSSDIRDWSRGEKHNIAITWKINTVDKRDELHLFIDGLEVPNIIKYGGVPQSSIGDRFRTIKPEFLNEPAVKNTITGRAVIENGSNIITALDIDFGISEIYPGDIITIKEIGFSSYTILSVDGRKVEVDHIFDTEADGARFSVNQYSTVVDSRIDIYKNISVSIISASGGEEVELPGLRADLPGYEISKNSLNENVLTILGNVKVGDRLVIRTLGLNYRLCKDTIYLWSPQSVLKTQLPAPINLDDVIIRSVILPHTVIGPDSFDSVTGNVDVNLSGGSVSNEIEGRHLAIRVSGSNIDFTSEPVSITITGTSDGGIFETIIANETGVFETSYKWRSIDDIHIVAKPINPQTNCLSIDIKELKPVTSADGNNIYPVIRYSYQSQHGISLENSGAGVLTDSSGSFSNFDIGKILVIETPASASGSYRISEKVDDNTIIVDGIESIPVFSGGQYSIYNASIGRAGFQNGYFFLEQAGTVGTPYLLPEGTYEFEFPAYLEIPFSPVSDLVASIGSDFFGKNQANSIIDEFRILSYQMVDTRVGETVPKNGESITTGSYKIRPFRKNKQTLVLLHFDGDIVNDADYWRVADRGFIQSSSSVNENFGKSIVFKNKGLTFDNDGYINTVTEGTIEFWVSPMYDTFNDPVERVYFDASSSLTEKVESISKREVRISSRARSILDVSISKGDKGSGVNYYTGGKLYNDAVTIGLGTVLPNQVTPVNVTYIPYNFSGDRITIFKDREGYICFRIIASGNEFEIRQPVFWERNSWHRVRATYRLNSSNNQDSMRLFIDGEERRTVRFGEGDVFGGGLLFGASASSIVSGGLSANIDFKDFISKIYIGQDHLGYKGANARMDNIRLSDKSLDPILIGGQGVDTNFGNNIQCVYPVIENAYTTMLLNFDDIMTHVTDFAELRDEVFGIFNFDLNIIDSFSIIKDNGARLKDMLESMIYSLKPANSKVNIKYFR